MAKTTPAYTVLAPLRHDGIDYAPGDPAPASLTDEQVAFLLSLQVIGVTA